jgi:hypothetical protein
VLEAGLPVFLEKVVERLAAVFKRGRGLRPQGRNEGEEQGRGKSQGGETEVFQRGQILGVESREKITFPSSVEQRGGGLRAGGFGLQYRYRLQSRRNRVWCVRSRRSGEQN